MQQHLFGKKGLIIVISTLMVATNIIQTSQNGLAVNIKYVIMKFDDYYWHDAVIENIQIDRRTPGIIDTITFDITWPWPSEKKSKFIFEGVYWAKMNLGFGVIAPDSILEAYIAPNEAVELVDFNKRWKDILIEEIYCYIIKTSSTGSEIIIIATGFKVVDM